MKRMITILVIVALVALVGCQKASPPEPVVAPTPEPALVVEDPSAQETIEETAEVATIDKELDTEEVELDDIGALFDDF